MYYNIIKNVSQVQNILLRTFIRRRLTAGPGFGTNILARPEYSVPTSWSGPNTRYQHHDPARILNSNIVTRLGTDPTRQGIENDVKC